MLLDFVPDRSEVTGTGIFKNVIVSIFSVSLFAYIIFQLLTWGFVRRTDE